MFYNNEFMEKQSYLNRKNEKLYGIDITLDGFHASLACGRGTPTGQLVETNGGTNWLPNSPDKTVSLMSIAIGPLWIELHLVKPKISAESCGF